MSTIVELEKQKQEKLTGYQAVITSDHAYIHQGLAKTAIITASISAAYDIAFTTPSAESGKYVHWRPIGVTTSADYVAYQMTENETYTGGTDVTIFTRNRNINGASTVQALKSNVTATPAGTVIQSTGVGTSGNSVARSGGGAGANEEIILKPDTTYLITLTPAGATNIILTLFWYEENGFDGRFS